MRPPARSTYHHGDLRAALLAVARELLDEGGVPAVTVREAARRAGVSPGASYRHFADKDALLTALAVEGFEAFGQAMKAALDRWDGTGEAMGDMGVAYVRFAVEHPGMFRLMFGPAVADRSRSPELLAAIARATAAFEQGMRLRTDLAPGDPTAPLRAWAGVHGLATLIIDGMVPGHDPMVIANAVLKKQLPPGVAGVRPPEAPAAPGSSVPPGMPASGGAAAPPPTRPATDPPS